jgi:hypothetical protein
MAHHLVNHVKEKRKKEKKKKNLIQGQSLEILVCVKVLSSVSFRDYLVKPLHVV